MHIVPHTQKKFYACTDLKKLEGILAINICLFIQYSGNLILAYPFGGRVKLCHRHQSTLYKWGNRLRSTWQGLLFITLNTRRNHWLYDYNKSLDLIKLN